LTIEFPVAVKREHGWKTAAKAVVDALKTQQNDHRSADDALALQPFPVDTRPYCRFVCVLGQ
jgi:hypothetical protein